MGFGDDLIHTFNKNAAAIRHSDYFDHLNDRHNILLLGDSMADPSMADGAHNIANILKIGFLNDKVCVFGRFEHFACNTQCNVCILL